MAIAFYIRFGILQGFSVVSLFTMLADQTGLDPHHKFYPNAVTLVTGVTLFLVSFVYLSYMGRK